LIVSGVYIHGSNIQGEWNLRDLWQPFVSIWKNPGTRLFALAMIPPVFSIVYDKKTVLDSDPLTMTTVVITMIGIGTSIYAFSVYKKIKIPNFKIWAGRFLLMGFVLAVTVIAYNAAIGMAFVSYIGALKRISILVTMFLAYFFLGEKHFKNRLVGATVLVSGAILISVVL
jgi:uncharacterized membrane protein